MNQQSSQALPGSDKGPEPVKPRRHRMRWIIISILVVVFVIFPVLAIAYTGIWNVPVLTPAFGSDRPIDLGVEISDQAITTGLAKTPWKTLSELPPPPTTSFLEQRPEYRGSVPVTNDITSEEFSSFMNNRFSASGDLESIQVKFNDGGAELSAKLNRYIDSPIYIKSGITTSADNTLVFDVQQIKIGRLSVPQTWVKQFEEAATDFINGRMEDVEGFTIERLVFKDSFVDFRGTYPEMVIQD